RRRRHPIFQANPSTQSFKMVLCWTSVELYSVDFFYAEARMRKPLSEFPVVREEQQSRRIEVQSPDWKDPLPYTPTFQKPAQVRPAFRIFYSGNNSWRFVKSKVNRRARRFEPLAVNFDTVFACVCLSAELADDRPVHGDAPVQDPLFGLPARRKTGPREDLL